MLLLGRCLLLLDYSLFAVDAFVVHPPPTASSIVHSIHGFNKKRHRAFSATTRRMSADPNSFDHKKKIKIVFSDLDGTLIHYPKKKTEPSEQAQSTSEDESLLPLPASATGMKGVISAATLQKCRRLRQEHGVKLVLVSGMRTSTLLNRLPYLPKADAYCTEAGGRIFYPTPAVLEKEEEEAVASEIDQHVQWTPVQFQGALPEDLEPFGLQEDMIWRETMELEQSAGKDGFAGNEVFSNRLCGEDDDDDEECLIDYDNFFGFPRQKDVIPVAQRDGALWEFARQLEHNSGFVIDTKSYSTCFRVNRKHQIAGAAGGDTKFEALLKGDIAHPPQLGKSTNLGCIDIYPASSGKQNCCQYIADSLDIDLSTESVCMCDDDNDVEMALACGHAYITALTSESMEACIRENPARLTLTYEEGRVEETQATEAALDLISQKLV